MITKNTRNNIRKIYSIATKMKKEAEDMRDLCTALNFEPGVPHRIESKILNTSDMLGDLIRDCQDFLPETDKDSITL